MSRKSAILAGALLALAVAAVPAARADYFYSVSTTPTSIQSDNNQMFIQVDPQASGGPITGASTFATYAHLFTYLTVPGFAGTDTFNTGQSTQLNVGVFQPGGPQTNSTTFNLDFAGSLSAKTSQASVTVDGGQTESKIVAYNGHNYQVTISLTDPKLTGLPLPADPPNTTNPTDHGTLAYAVTGNITDLGAISSGGTTSGGTTSGGTTSGGTTSGGTTSGGTTSGGPSTAPEPSTMVLACLGAALFGAGGWRKWRGKKAAA